MSFIIRQMKVLAELSILAFLLALIWYVIIGLTGFVDNYFKDNSTYTKISF